VDIRDHATGDQNLAGIRPGSDRYRDMLGARRVERRSRDESVRCGIVELSEGQRIAIVLLTTDD